MIIHAYAHTNTYKHTYIHICMAGNNAKGYTRKNISTPVRHILSVRKEASVMSLLHHNKSNTRQVSFLERPTGLQQDVKYIPKIFN